MFSDFLRAVVPSMLIVMGVSSIVLGITEDILLLSGAGGFLLGFYSQLVKYK